MTDTPAPFTPEPPAVTSPRQTRIRWIILGLVLLTMGCYFRVGRFDFINYDDPKYITDNPDLANGFTFDAFLTSFTSTAGGYRHPVTWWSHLIDVSLFGTSLGTGAAGGHHVMNLLFHTANTVLLFWVLFRLTAAVWPSAWVAAMFAVHPAHVESVAWISERKDMLSGLFFLLTIWAYQVYTERPDVRRYLLVVAAFIGALMSKPMMVTTPGVLLLLDLWPLRRLDTRKPAASGVAKRLGSLIVEKLPLFALSLLSGWITIRDTASIGSFAGTETYPVSLRLETSIIAYARYLGKLFWPTNLAIFYPYPLAGWTTAAVAGAVVLFLVLTALAVWQMKKRPYLLIGWLWFVGTLLPVIGIFISGDASLADRYTYVPFIGLFIALAWLAREIGTKLRAGKVVGGLGVVTVLACAAVTFVHLPNWRDSLSIMGHAKSVTKDNWTALMQYGTALSAERRNDEAAEYYRQVLQIRPKLQVAHVQYARYLTDIGQFADAQKHLREAATMDPEHPGFLMALGQLSAKVGHHEDALRYYDRAIAKRAGRAETTLLSAYSLLALGRTDEAQKRLQTVIALDPRNAQAHHRLGLIASAKRDIPTAEQEFAIAIDLAPDWGIARLDYGLLLARLGRGQEAAEQLDQAVKLFGPKEATNRARAESALARLLEMSGRQMEGAAKYLAAVESARAGVADRPRDPDSQLQLATVLKQTNQLDEARTVAAKAAELATASRNNTVLAMVKASFPEVVTTQPTTNPTTQTNEPRTK